MVAPKSLASLLPPLRTTYVHCPCWVCHWSGSRPHRDHRSRSSLLLTQRNGVPSFLTPTRSEQQHPPVSRQSLPSAPYEAVVEVSGWSENTSVPNLIPLFRFPMLAQVQLLSEMQTYMSVGFPKPWPRRSWNSCSHSMGASLLLEFLSTRSLVSRQWFWTVLCSLTGRLWNILSPHTAVLPLEHIKGICGPENAIFCWNCS